MRPPHPDPLPRARGRGDDAYLVPFQVVRTEVMRSGEGLSLVLVRGARSLPEMG